MRLRPLSEAECYARCYGGRRDEAVNVLRFRDLENGASESPERHERGEDDRASPAADGVDVFADDGRVSSLDEHEVGERSGAS